MKGVGVVSFVFSLSAVALPFVVVVIHLEASLVLDSAVSSQGAFLPKFLSLVELLSMSCIDAEVHCILPACLGHTLTKRLFLQDSGKLQVATLFLSSALL